MGRPAGGSLAKSISKSHSDCNIYQLYVFMFLSSAFQAASFLELPHCTKLHQLLSGLLRGGKNLVTLCRCYLT